MVGGFDNGNGNGNFNGADPLMLSWLLFSESGEAGYYMLYSDLYGDDEEGRDKRLD